MGGTALARQLRRLASFGRLVLFDKRGTGLSDPVPLDRPPTLEQRADDLDAVLDAVSSSGSRRGGVDAMFYAATRPERVRSLVLYGSWPRFFADDSYPTGWRPDTVRPVLEAVLPAWGQGDVRSVLPAITAPTLVLHRAGDVFAPVEHGRYLAAHIPRARYVELAGADHPFFIGDGDAVLDAVEEFLTGTRPPTRYDRVLATALFVDIVGSTELAATLGDAGWRDLLESYYAVVGAQLDHFAGTVVDTAGDGLFAAFDGPARAVACATALRDAVAELGVEVRAGLHTGEFPLIDGKIGGLPVHIAARVAALARPGEVWASRTIKDLAAGAGIRFDDRGSHLLKGVPDEWQLYRVEMP